MSWTYTDTADQVIAVTECTTDLVGAHIGINARDGRSVIVCVPADKRRNAAQAVAGDDHVVVPAEQTDDMARMHLEYVRAALDLGLNDGPAPSRDVSPQQMVEGEILPAIERLKSTASMPTWERELLAGQGYEQEIVALKRERDDLQERLARAAVEAAGEYGPADIARAKADALHAFADTMDRLPDDWILVRRDYGSEVTVEDLLRQTADRYVEHPYPILTQIRVDPKQPDRPDPVDPASVRVGDYVEVVQQHDDVPLRITVEGEVYQLGRDERRLFHIRGYGGPAIGDVTSVRILRREPEPDEAAVNALADGLVDQYQTIQDGKWRDAARALIRDHGVQVEVPNA